MDTSFVSLARDTFFNFFGEAGAFAASCVWCEAGSTQTERFVRSAAPTTPGTLVELRVWRPRFEALLMEQMGLHTLQCRPDVARVMES